MKRLIVALTTSFALLALGACGKQETKPEATPADTSIQQQVPATEEQKVDEQKAGDSAQADQYNGMAQAQAEDETTGPSAADQS